MNKRDLAASVASRTRIVSVLERLRSRPALAVLVYHRILRPEDHPYDRDVIEASPEQFDDQMRMLRKRYDVATPDELPGLVANPRQLRHFRVGITFDDGYRDNYTNAFPILKSHGLKAIFFLPTHFVGTMRLPWWDRIANLVRTSKRSTITLEYPKRVSVVVDRADPEPAIRTVIRAYTRSTGVELEKFLAEVERACDGPLPAEGTERQFLSFEEAAEMQAAGMGIGSHSHSHTVLGNMLPEDQRDECLRSREVLEASGLRADTFAYPVGQPTSFSKTTMGCVKEAGYRVAFSNYGGINLPDQLDPFDVRRLGMGMDEDVSRLRLRLALSQLRGRAVW